MGKKKKKKPKTLIKIGRLYLYGIEERHHFYWTGFWELILSMTNEH